MDPAIDLLRESLLTAGTLLGGPVLLALVLGGLCAAFQTMTSMQDPTMAFVPRLIGVGLFLVLLAPWFLARLVDFANAMFANAGLPWSQG